ncbi:hypothetical protein GUJ93_ZPchr0007g4756 [Zizania palustris]|uniref:Pentatricopeptide repeat-containing protein n=1 Tax=Zizania palustris TaxID=103762 RepID=A0A8J5VYZ1_ZIZPA|nr:hypothetical protein GUJ93_ZPchr0007g4756 [Zizania palustris]
MHRAVPGFLRRALVMRNHPLAPRFTSLACCLNNLDHQEHTQSDSCSDYRTHYLLPLITLAVRTSDWDVARKINFRECVRLYGPSQSIGLFALLIQSFLPRRIREVRCLIQSIVDYSGNAGPELFELALMLVNNLGGLITLLQVYAAFIRFFIELSMFEDALVTYIEAKKVGVELQLCNFLLKSLVRRNQVMENKFHKAVEVFDEMKKGGFAPDVHSYSIIVDGLCKQGDLLSGCDVLVEMARTGVSPTLVSYSSLLHGLCKAGKVEKALELFESLKDQDVYNYTSLIYAFCRHRYLKEALELFELMLDNGINPNIVTCTILVDGFMREGLIGEAFLFLDEVRHFDIVPNLYTYKVIINGLCKVNESSDVWEIFADMIKRGYVPDVILYSIIIDGFVKALNLHEAFRLYHKMLDEGTMPNIVTYTSLINGLCHDDRLPEMMTLLKDMILEGLTPDKILYTSLIACYCKRSNMKAALDIFREMEERGISPDTFVYTCLIDGFSKVLAMDGALWLMEEMKNKGLTPTVVTYTDLITGYFKTGDEKSAYRMYHNMIQAGNEPPIAGKKSVRLRGAVLVQPLWQQKGAFDCRSSFVMKNECTLCTFFLCSMWICLLAASPDCEAQEARVHAAILHQCMDLIFSNIHVRSTRDTGANEKWSTSIRGTHVINWSSLAALQFSRFDSAAEWQAD